MKWTLSPALSREEDVAGIDIGDRTIAAARVESEPPNGLRLTHAGCLDYDPAAPERQTALAVRALWRKAEIPTRTVCSCLHSRATAVRYFQYPNLSEEELDSALLLEAEETLQLSRDEILMDWLLNEQRDGAAAGESASKEGVLVATPRTDVERHLSLLSRAGLFPIVLDIGCLAVANLFAALKTASDASKVVCLVHLDDRRADVAILFTGNRICPRTVYTRAASWRESSDHLASCLTDLFKYHEFKLRQPAVEQVILTGRPADDDLTEALREQTRLPVDRWDPWPDIPWKSARADRWARQEPDLGARLAVGLGAALRRE